MSAIRDLFERIIAWIAKKDRGVQYEVLAR